MFYRRSSRGIKTDEGKIKSSDLFDVDFYLSHSPDVINASYDPLKHFMNHGWREGRRPNPCFDPAWYRDMYLPEDDDRNPLLHYIDDGEGNGKRPIMYFDPQWYREHYHVPSSVLALTHYLLNNRTGTVAPNPFFDLKLYLATVLVPPNCDPFQHYISSQSTQSFFTAARKGWVTENLRHAAKEQDRYSIEMRKPIVYAMDSDVRLGLNRAPVDPAEECVAECAEVFARKDGRHRRLLDELKAIHHPDSYLIARIAIVLRRDHAPELAEELMIALQDLPGLATRTARELMYIKGMNGQSAAALPYYEALRTSEAAYPHDHFYGAWCHMRCGDAKRAARIINDVYMRWPHARNECLASGEFFRFYNHYGLEVSQTMLAQVQAAFRPDDAGAVEQSVRQALEQRRPYLLLRLGDGEGSHIQIDDEDELNYGVYYRENRKEFLDIWFRDTSCIENVDWYDIMIEFNKSISKADCIGGIYEAAVTHEYNIGSRRGIAWVVNAMRKVMQLASDDPDWARRTFLCDLVIHYRLLLSGGLHRIIEQAQSIGLISCHEGLAGALERRFGFSEVEFYKVPGEQMHGAELGERACEGRHWPDTYDRIMVSLAEPMDRRGQLFLVAAGILGKIYAARLKDAGAVVLDIGAVADLWMGKKTRRFPDLPEDLKLG